MGFKTAAAIGAATAAGAAGLFKAMKDKGTSSNSGQTYYETPPTASLQPTDTNEKVASVVDGVMLNSDGVPVQTEQDLTDDKIRAMFNAQGEDYSGSTDEAVADRIVGDSDIVQINGKSVDRRELQRKFGVTVLTPAEARASGIDVPMGSDSPVYTNLGIEEASSSPKMFGNKIDSHVISSSNPDRQYGDLLRGRVNFERTTEANIKTRVEEAYSSNNEVKLLTGYADDYNSAIERGAWSSPEEKKSIMSSLGKAEARLSAIRDEVTNRVAKEYKSSADYKLTETQLTQEETQIAAQRRLQLALGASSHAGTILKKVTGMRGPQANIQVQGGVAKAFTDRIINNNDKPLPLFQPIDGDIQDEWNLSYAYSEDKSPKVFKDNIKNSLNVVRQEAVIDMTRKLAVLGTTKAYINMTDKQVKEIAGKRLYEESYSAAAKKYVASSALIDSVNRNTDPKLAKLITANLVGGELNSEAFIASFSKDTNLMDIANELSALNYDISTTVGASAMTKAAGVTPGDVNPVIASFINSLRQAERAKTAAVRSYSAPAPMDVALDTARFYGER